MNCRIDVPIDNQRIFIKKRKGKIFLYHGVQQTTKAPKK
jgi:hypothetical protein